MKSMSMRSLVSWIVAIALVLMIVAAPVDAGKKKPVHQKHGVHHRHLPHVKEPVHPHFPPAKKPVQPPFPHAKKPVDTKPQKPVQPPVPHTKKPVATKPHRPVQPQVPHAKKPVHTKPHKPVQPQVPHAKKPVDTKPHKPVQPQVPHAKKPVDTKPHKPVQPPVPHAKKPVDTKPHKPVQPSIPHAKKPQNPATPVPQQKKTSTSGLSDTFYSQTCPGALQKIQSLVKSLVQKDNTLPAAWLRLHFHDCFVHGCDASVLINGSDPNTEVNALPNRGSIRGLDVLETIKTAVEAMCPGVVSCADILALAARDSVNAIGGPCWPVPLGRRDGLVSVAADANRALPNPFSNYSTLVQNFVAVGLDAKDMVVLSGAHTIGVTHCGLIAGRLANNDPTLDKSYAQQLRQKCPVNSTAAIFLDPTKGGQAFDSMYFSNALANKGLLVSDATLITDPTGLSIVKREAVDPKGPFFTDFSYSMVRMGQLNVLTGTQGQIRKKCSAFNT